MVNAVARTEIEPVSDVCPVLLMKVVTVCLADSGVGCFLGLGAAVVVALTASDCAPSPTALSAMTA